jgi:hypothetical protein
MLLLRHVFFFPRRHVTLKVRVLEVNAVFVLKADTLDRVHKGMRPVFNMNLFD